MDFKMIDSSRELTMEQITEVPIDKNENKKKRGRKAKAKIVQSFEPQESMCSAEKHVHFEEDDFEESREDCDGIDVNKLTSKKK